MSVFTGYQKKRKKKTSPRISFFIWIDSICIIYKYKIIIVIDVKVFGG